MDDIADLARRELGYESLRPGQEAAARAVVSGRDVLAVMPTGSGKSAIYQLAGLAGLRPVLVVSPLIALQQDQTASLGAAGIGPAAEINSTLNKGERDEALRRLAAGALRFAFLSPEALANEEVAAAVAACRPGLFVVDEAHCVTSWGHDFRPDYLHLAEAARAAGRPPVLALTATAAPPVRDAIIDALELDDPEVVVSWP